MKLRRHLSRTAVAAATILLAAPAVFPEVASAAVGEAEAEVQRIVDELERLQTQADILAEDYAEAVDQKGQLDVEVVEAEQRVAAKQAELNELRGDLSEVAIRSFTGSGADVLGPLFSSPTQYGEGLQRDQYSRVALSVGTTTTDDLDELIADLDQEKADLESKRAQVEALTQTISEKQEQTEQLTAQYVEARVDAEARLGEEIRKEEERRAAEAYAALQAELAAQQQAAANTSSNGGGGGGGGDTSNSGGTSNSNSGGSNDSGTSNSGNSSGNSGSSNSGSSGSSGSSGGGSSAPAVSGLAGIAVQAAYGQLGVPYRYATSLPGVSFDCSGLTHYAWGQAGVYLPRNSRAQAAATPRVSPAAAQPGDLIFYYSPISHVGIYVGGGQLVHAPNSGTVVKVASVSWNKVTAVGRPG
ncbi:cell wall-associated NlpC family hydrolase [Ilumatobacter fluminis]|uniref:Cell wall-associated NlpC family hydrolase n=1 Tax=Ilumatobacter fluminis TaxID=467091 RepID=A0A4R7HZ90_9ACTN|nr:C40 family peptidase [Ilumatobacter fluminis]TDT15473.1 cell wall-associated NlpC family hydrolase [Ilumatobacter fluminis]